MGEGELMDNEAAGGMDPRVDTCERKVRRKAASEPNFDLIDLAAEPDKRRIVPVAPGIAFDWTVLGKKLI
jgi:hypothetical protein